MRVPIIRVTSPLQPDQIFSFVQSERNYLPYLLREGRGMTVVRKINKGDDVVGLTVEMIDERRLIATNDELGIDLN